MTALFSAFPAMVPADSFVEIDGIGLKLNWSCKEPKNSHIVRHSENRIVLVSLLSVALVPRELNL